MLRSIKQPALLGDTARSENKGYFPIQEAFFDTFTLPDGQALKAVYPHFGQGKGKNSQISSEELKSSRKKAKISYDIIHKIQNKLCKDYKEFVKSK